MKENIGRSQRNYNIDIIKIFAMFLVVVIHITGVGGIEANCRNLTTQLLIKIVYSISWCCINLFSLSTGYLLCAVRANVKRILTLWAQVFFYSIGGFIVIFFISRDRGIINFSSIAYMFPICFSKYWYMSVYFALYILAPFYNKLIENLNKKQFSWLMIIALICFSVIPTLAGEDTFLIGGVSVGQSFVWLTTMYFLGAYIRKYRITIHNCVLVSLICLMIAAMVAFSYIPKQYVSFGEKKFSLTDYSSVTVLIMSVAVFLLLLNMKLNVGPMTGKIIKAFSVSSLSVYLIHTHELVFYKYIIGHFSWVGDYSALKAVLITIGISLAIMLVCSLIGMIQLKLFEAIGINRLCAYLGDKIMCLKAKIEKKFI